MWQVALIVLCHTVPNKHKTGAQQPLKSLSLSAILFLCAVSFDSVIISAEKYKFYRWFIISGLSLLAFILFIIPDNSEVLPCNFEV